MYCLKCGKQFPDQNNFCPHCGWKVIKKNTAPQAPVTPVRQPVYTAPVQPQPIYVAQPQPQPVQPAAQKPVKKKKRWGWLKALIIITLIVALIFTAVVQPAWLPALIKSGKPLPDSYKNGSTCVQTVTTGFETAMGDSKRNGYTITVAPDLLPNNSAVTMKVLDQKESRAYKSGDYTLLGSPVSLEATGYEGQYFGKNVTLTFAIPFKYQKENVQDWFIAYFNPRTNETEYYSPDYVDFEKQEIVFTVPHFSEYVPVEVKREEAIEIYCKKYASEQAMAQQDAKKLKDLMEPELTKLMAEIGIPKEQYADCLNAINSGILSKCQEGKLNDSLGVGNNLLTAVYKYCVNGDYDAYRASLTQTATEEVAKYALESKGISTSVHPYPAKIVAGLVTKSGSIYGSLETGDYKQVAADILDIGVSLEPSTAIAMAVANLLKATANQIYHNFQANEIEKLYSMYRYGTDDFAAGNFKDLWDHIDGDFFYMKQRGAERLLTVDFVKQYCDARGWAYTTFDNLPESYRTEISNEARNQLQTYFSKRAEAEKVSEKMYKDERKFVRGLYGIMDSTIYSDFFGESHGYDPQLRLQKIYQIRAKIEALADTSKTFSKVDWSSFVFDWIVAANEGVDEDELYRRAIAALKKRGILKDGIDVQDYKELTADDICGVWDPVVLSARNIELPIVEGIVNTFCNALGVSSDGIVEKHEEDHNFRVEITKVSGEKVRLKLIQLEGGSNYSVYEGTLKKGSLKLHLKENHLGSGAAGIQISMSSLTLKFTRCGKFVLMSDGYHVKSPVVCVDLLFSGQKPIDTRQ